MNSIIINKAINNIMNKYSDNKSKLAEYIEWKKNIISVIFKNNSRYSLEYLNGLSNDRLFDIVEELITTNNSNIVTVPPVAPAVAPTSSPGLSSRTSSGVKNTYYNFDDTVNCLPSSINNFISGYYNITNKLGKKNRNNRFQQIETYLKTNGVGNSFDIEKYYKFNPSIVKIQDDPLKFFLTYRIYIGGEFDCDNYTVDTDCHYWDNWWASTVQNKDIKLNYLGVAILDENFDVEYETILEFDNEDGKIGLEDCRILIDKQDNIENLYINGAFTRGKTDVTDATDGDDRILRTFLTNIGSKQEILDDPETILNEPKSMFS